MLKTYQRKTKLFEFLGESNWEEMMRKKRHFAMASLCNDPTSLYTE